MNKISKKEDQGESIMQVQNSLRCYKRSIYSIIITALSFALAILFSIEAYGAFDLDAGVKAATV